MPYTAINLYLQQINSPCHLYQVYRIVLNIRADRHLYGHLKKPCVRVS